MIVLIILFLICIISYYFLIRYDFKNDLLESLMTILFAVSLVCCIVLGLIALYAHNGYEKQAEYNKFIEKYNAIMDAFNSEESNKIVLVQSISEYNAKVLNGRLSMDSPIHSFYNFDFYYDLPLIQ